MRLTLLRAKEALVKKAPIDELEFRLNRACERLLLHGKFAGTVQRLAISAPYGQLTLPRRYRTLEGIKVDGSVYDIANQWYEFLPGRSDALGYSLAAVRDLGDGWAVMRTPNISSTDPTAPIQDFPAGDISVTYSGSEVLVVNIEGWDANGLPVTLTFNGKETHASPFARVSRIHKEQGDVSVIVNFTDTDAVVTPIALMEPSEEETYYRRYQVDTLVDQPTVAVSALCKRRHIEFASDNDILPFSNLSALSLALDALQFEAENDQGRADELLGSAVELLNAELKDTNGENELPAIRFLYPAGTKPQWTSNY